MVEWRRAAECQEATYAAANSVLLDRPEPTLGLSQEELLGDNTEETIKRHGPIQSPDLFGDAFDPQQVAHPSTRPIMRSVMP
jgi:hypothetical protein